MTDQPASWFPQWASVLDWSKVLTDAEDADIEWLAYPFLETGTVSSMYCDPKDGKSLITQVICKQIALGEAVLGSPATEPRPVLYLDYENPESIVGERFQDMGASASELAPWLVYSSFPAMKPLDTPEGGEMLWELVSAMTESGHPPALIVIDTLSKTFTGAESSADTFSDLYRHSLLPLRRVKMTVLYLDHSGKDPAAGQRGSSAKPSDVDVVWRLHSRKGARDLIESASLEPTHSRAGHVEAFSAAVRQEPLRVQLDRMPVSARALELSAGLQKLGTPATASRKECREALKKAGITAKTSVLAEAVKYRKAAGDNAGTAPPGTDAGTAWGQGGQTYPDLGGQSGDRVDGGRGDNGPSLKRGPLAQPGRDRAYEEPGFWLRLHAQACERCIRGERHKHGKAWVAAVPGHGERAG
jgi:hypothetical protein